MIFKFPSYCLPVSQYEMAGTQGRSQDFLKRGHTVSNIIVMAFSPRNIVGCLLKKRLAKGGTRVPEDPPSYALAGTHAASSNYAVDMNTYI